MTNTKFQSAINIILAIVLIPVTVLGLLCSFLMYNAKTHNEMPSLFGYSSVVIVSDSMVAGGFNVGDQVMVKKQNTATLKVGDIIAFYEVLTPSQQNYHATESTSTNINNPQTPTLLTLLGGGVYTQEQQVAAENGSRVFFHRISAIRIGEDSSGKAHYYFETQGDGTTVGGSRLSPDTYLVMDNYVVGKYTANGSFFAGVFKFCSSVTGIILLVLVPCVVLIVLLIQSIIVQGKQLKVEIDETSSRLETYNTVLNRDAGVPDNLGGISQAPQVPNVPPRSPVAPPKPPVAPPKPPAVPPKPPVVPPKPPVSQ